MSTRSFILVKGKNSYSEHVIRLYKHCDGYPTENLRLIYTTFKKCLDEIEKHKGFYKKYFKPEFFAYKLIGESATIYGKGAYVDGFENDTGEYEEKFKLEHIANQFDIEWIYVVDLEQKSVNIYGGGYAGEGPQFAFKKGFVNPEKFIEQLYPKHQSKHLKKIKKFVKGIESLGFSVNKIKDKVSKAKKNKETESWKRIKNINILFCH